MSKATPVTKADNTAIEKAKPSAAERFTMKVAQEFQGAVGQAVALTDFQKKLAANLFIHVDASLKALEAKRSGTAPEFTWDNVNMNKLAIDAMHRINLGLDATIKNHIFVVPYLNGKTNQYDLDLTIGFVGKLYYRKQAAVIKPKDVVLHLVHKNDHFVPLMRDANRPSDSYEFQITNPFDRGDIIGGFGYIVYDDSTMNTLVIVSEADFAKYRNAAKSKGVWDLWPIEMRYKSLVHRVSEKIEVDPHKANNSFNVVEADEKEQMLRDPDLKGLTEVTIDIEMPVVKAEVTADFSAQSKPVNDPASGVKSPFED